MKSDIKPFGDTLIKGALARMNGIQFPEDAEEVTQYGFPEEFCGKYGVTFTHSDGGVSLLVVSDEPEPCAAFLAGATFLSEKINRWIEKGDIVIANA